MPRTDHAEAFQAQLRAMAAAIRRESRGRCCGDCRWFGFTCSRPTVIDMSVTIESADAVACRAWKKGKVAA